MSRLPDTSAWDACYLESGALWGHFPALSAEETWWRLRTSGARRVLVPGCGYGRHVAYFSRKGFDTTGLDASRAAIELAHEAAREDGLELLLTCASATRMPFPHAAFDAIYDHALLHHLTAEDRAATVEEYRRVLRPGGLLVVSALSRADARFGAGERVEDATFADADGRIEHYFSAGELTEALDGFVVESLTEVTERAEEGCREERRYLRAVARRIGERELAARGRRKWGNQRPRLRHAS